MARFISPQIVRKNANVASVRVRVGASRELKLLSQQVRCCRVCTLLYMFLRQRAQCRCEVSSSGQAEMERVLLQQHDALRHQNNALRQQIEISRRNQDALNSKLSHVISTFQHVANRLSTSRPTKSRLRMLSSSLSIKINHGMLKMALRLL